MKSEKTRRRETYKKTVKNLLEVDPKARTIAQKYRVLAYTLSKEWPSKVEASESFKSFLQDVVYIDRMIRKATEGEDEFNKKVASQQFIIDELQ